MIDLSFTGIHDPLAYSIFGDDIPNPEQRLKEYYDMSIWFIM